MLEFTTALSIMCSKSLTNSKRQGDVISSFVVRIETKPDSLLILKTFQLLSMLISSHTYNDCHDSIKDTVVTMWANLPLEDRLLLADGCFANVIHLGIESGSEVAFLTLSSSVSQEPFNYDQGWEQLKTRRTSLQCMWLPFLKFPL